MDWSAALPPNMLRGLRKKKWVYDDGTISWEAFFPSYPAHPREDGSQETSVNWEDDEGALTCLRKSAHAQFGAARLLAKRAEPFVERALLALERRQDPDDPDNRYHGNVVFAANLPKAKYRELAGAIAIFAMKIQ